VENPEKQGTRTLVEMLRLKRKLNITIDPTLCAMLTSLDIAEALKFMHKSNTLHGDLKPHNILLVSAPQVRPCRHGSCVSPAGGALFHVHVWPWLQS
jgi:serine/threonine protein kinase